MRATQEVAEPHTSLGVVEGVRVPPQDREFLGRKIGIVESCDGW